MSAAVAYELKDLDRRYNPPLHRTRSNITFHSNTFHQCCPLPCDAESVKSSPGSEGSEVRFDLRQGPSMPERWSACSQVTKDFDETMVKGWKEDIDTLLVFAGLFSAVLTAFNVDSYRQLQFDPNMAALLLLQQISVQLNALGSSVQVGGINATAQQFATQGPQMSSPGGAVRINTAWFAALVCSLTAALIGILAKQWLREYLLEISSSPRENVRLRQFRHDGLTKWHVAAIIGFLPILLEISVVSFLYGLLELLWTLDNTVAGVSTAFVLCCFLFYLGTTVHPAFSTNSPFKSPQSWAFCVFLWKTRQLCRYLWSTWVPDVLLSKDLRMDNPWKSDCDTGIDDIRDAPLPGTWREREYKYIRLKADELDRRALARSYKRSLDDDFLDAVTPCLNELKPEHAASLAFEVVARRGDCTVPALLESIRQPGPRLALETFMLRAGKRGTKRLIYMLLDVLPRMFHDAERSQITAFDVLKTLRKLLTEAERAVCEREIHRRALDTLALLIDERGSYRFQKASLDVLWEMTHLGCNTDYCPDGITNVIFCARDAHTRGDHDTFVRACGVLLGRLPALPPHIQFQQWHGRQWLRDWIRDLEEYFRARNRRNLRYDVGIQTKWCSGLAAMAGKEKELLRAELISALEEGARLGLVDCDLEERDALHQLKNAYSMERCQETSV